MLSIVVEETWSYVMCDWFACMTNFETYWITNKDEAHPFPCMYIDQFTKM